VSTFDKLIQKIFSRSSISYKEAERVLFKLGYTLSIRGSHHGFRKEGCTTIVLLKTNQLLPYQNKYLQEALYENGYEKDK